MTFGLYYKCNKIECERQGITADYVGSTDECSALCYKHKIAFRHQWTTDKIECLQNTDIVKEEQYRDNKKLTRLIASIRIQRDLWKVATTRTEHSNIPKENKGKKIHKKNQSTLHQWFHSKPKQEVIIKDSDVKNDVKDNFDFDTEMDNQSESSICSHVITDVSDEDYEKGYYDPSEGYYG
jgi:hypothetical protein